MPLAKPTKPDAITAVPTPVPLRTDRANFAVRGDAMMGWFPTGIAGVNTTLTYFGNAVNFVEQEANEAEASATAAAASNLAAGVNAAAAAASAGATVWVTGTTYSAGAVKYSPTNFQTYRDTVGGVSNTDPASDTTGRWISAMLPSVEAIGLPDMYPTAVLIGNGQIDRRLVQGRTATKYRYNTFGNLEALPAGVSKVDFHPVTKRCEGYKSEPALNYLAINSADFAGWGASDIGGGFGANTTAPDGTNTAVLWTAPNSTSSFAYAAKVATGDGSVQATYEVWIKRISGVGNISLNVSDNSVLTSHGGVLAVTADWQKFSWTSAGITNTGVVGMGFNSITPGDVFALWHPTLTLGTTKNPSYYPTVGSLVTTVADSLSLDLTAHAEVINPEEFTVVMAVDGTSIVGSGTSQVWFQAGVDSSNEIFILSVSNGWYAYGYLGGAQFQTLFGTVTAGRNVFVASFRAGQCLGVKMGGGLVSLGALPSMPSMTSMRVGHYSGASQASSPIELIAIYPRACTAGELTALVNNF